MRIIIKMAKHELRHLFYSPVGWFLALIMLVVSALFYTNLMVNYAITNHIVKTNNPQYLFWMVDSITEVVYNKPGGLFITILNYLPLFVPLLTMGIISKEFNNGAIRLLYSSPVKLRQIILGKFLAMLVFNLFLVAIIGIFVILGFFDLQSLDVPPLLSGMLGMFLMMSAFTAIGFFLSAITSYQIVTAIASFTLFWILSVIGNFWQEYALFRDISWFLAIPKKIGNMVSGLISSRDILYYLVIMFMFISFTLLKLRNGIVSSKWYVRMAQYLAVTIAGLSIGYIGSRPATTLWWDTTGQKVWTIHPKTQELIGELNEGPLEVTLYSNLLNEAGVNGFPAWHNQYITILWERYLRFKKDIVLKYEYYYGIPEGDSTLYRTFPGKTVKEIAGVIAKRHRVDLAMFKPAEAMPDLSLLQSENFNLILVLKYKDRSTFLRTYFPDKGWPEEYNMNAGLSRLLNKPMPKVYFVSGQLERSIYRKGERDMYSLTLNKKYRRSLINNGFDLDSLNLSQQDIPFNTSLLVLADPRTDLPAPVMNKLQQYVAAGGSMVIAGEPGKQAVLNPLLGITGLQLMNGQLVQLNKHETPDKVSGYVNENGLAMSDEGLFRLCRYLWANGAFNDSAFLQLKGVTGLSGKGENGFEVKPVLMTQPNRAWQKQGKLVADSTLPGFNPQEGDSMQVSWPVAVQLTRMVKGKEQRIVVTGDADLFSSETGQNKEDLQRAIYSWSVFNTFPVYTPKAPAKDTRFKLSPERAVVQRFIFIWIVQSFVLLAAIIILIRRKRK